MMMKAKNSLALKKVYVLMVSFDANIREIWRRYRAKHFIECMRASRSLSASRIKGVWKLCMSRRFA